MSDQPSPGRIFSKTATTLRKILVLGAISLCRGMELLRSGAYRKEFELIETTHNSQMDITWALRECDGVVLRPTQSPRITPDMLAGVEPGKIIFATFSRAIEHVELPSSWPKSSIIAVTGEAAQLSAQAVADLTVLLALALLRRLFEVMSSTRNYRFDNTLFPAIQNLNGATWVIIGRGKHVQELLPLLLTHGVKKCIIWSKRLDAPSFAECLANLSLVSLREAHGMRALCRLGAREMEVVGVTDMEKGLYPALEQATVVSLHASSTTPEYHNLVNRNFLRHINPEAVVINTARGVLVEEEALVEALKNKKIAGYGADVIDARAESSGDPRYSPVWQYAIAAAPELPPAYLTSHFGGSIRSVLDGISETVIKEFLVRLGLPAPDSPILKTPLAVKGIVYDQK